MDDFLSAISNALPGERLAAAFLIQASGSTPQKPGAAVLVNAAGRIVGTVGGGILEAEAIRRAQQTLETGAAEAFSMTLDETPSADDALLCGGTVELMVIPLSDAHRAVLRDAAAALNDGRASALILVVDGPGDTRGALVLCDTERDRLTGQVTALPPDWQTPTRETHQHAPRRTQTIALPSGARVAVVPITPRTPLLLVGAGHIGRALARAAARLDFDITVLDDRAEFATRERFPDARALLVGDLAASIASLAPRPDRFIVLTTRSHAHDLAALRAALAIPHAYLGMLGSRRKVETLSASLRKQGVTGEALARIHTPVGLSIGAITPDEIAVSIAAQLVQARNLPRDAESARRPAEARR